MTGRCRLRATERRRNRRAAARSRRPAGAGTRYPARPAERSQKRETEPERRRVGDPPSGFQSYFLPSTASFRLFARRNLHTRLAGILRGSPVCGFRPMRALRFARTSLPKPGRRNTPLFLASFDARLSVSSRIPSICFRVRLVFSARYATVADFVIVFATGDLLSIEVVVERELHYYHRPTRRG